MIGPLSVLAGKEFRRSVSRKGAKVAKFGEINVEAAQKKPGWVARWPLRTSCLSGRKNPKIVSRKGREAW